MYYQYYLLASNLWIWLSSVTLWTDTIVSWRRILADSVSSTGMFNRLTFVDITAPPGYTRVSCILWLAGAHEAAEGVGTYSVFTAHCLTSLTFIHVWCNKQRNH